MPAPERRPGALLVPASHVPTPERCTCRPVRGGRDADEPYDLALAASTLAAASRAASQSLRNWTMPLSVSG